MDLHFLGSSYSWSCAIKEIIFLRKYLLWRFPTRKWVVAKWFQAMIPLGFITLQTAHFSMPHLQKVILLKKQWSLRHRHRTDPREFVVSLGWRCRNDLAASLNLQQAVSHDQLLFNNFLVLTIQRKLVEPFLFCLPVREGHTKSA